MYVSLETFQKYSNVFSDNTELQQSYINAAEDVVENFLGYSLIKKNYTAITNGKGRDYLQLKVKPINRIINIKINGEDIDTDEFDISEEFIIYKNGIFPEGKKNIIIEFEAGYSSNQGNGIDEIDGGSAGTNTEESNEDNDITITENSNGIPQVILITIMRIAAILQAESDSNVAIVSKSFGDSGSRTYVNYTNFDKYLIPISRYKLIII